MLHIESIAIAENLSNLKACAMALKTNYPKEKLGAVRVESVQVRKAIPVCTGLAGL